ncbi:MAG: alpha-2-macroglobulin family protein, partial [Planctomycetota bacterium]
GLSLLALLQGLFLLARRMQWRPEIVVPGGICATGLLVFLGLGSLAATMVEGRDDVMSRPAPESEAPRGFFYDDGLESDFRARTESFFATPGTGGGGVGLDLYGFGQTAGADDFLMGRGFRSGIQVVDADTGWNARLSAGALPRNVPFELGRSGLVVLNEAAGQASEAGLSGARFAIPDETAPQLQMRIHPNDFGLFYGSTSLVAPGGPTTVSPGVPFVRYLEGASYAYRHAAANARQSFVETLYWKPFLLTDAKGEATVEFEVSDRITTWSVHADAHGSGRVGQAEASFESFLPFHLEAKLPAQITAGDVVQAPIAVLADDPHQKEARVRLQVRGPLSLVSSGEQQVALVEGRGRILARLEVKEGHGKARLAAITITGHLGKARDEVTQTLLVLPRGFPRHESRAGTVRGKTELALVLPDEPARQSAKLTLRFYPSPLATIEQGLEGMLQEPHGCFEQASSSNYPNVMVLSLLEATGDNVPAASARARALLPAGYRKITGYECTERGYEWWGKNPGHAALTAYGLMQFQDMSRFHEVDQAMLARTRQWLLDKRDGKGGFGTAKGRYCHYWGGSEALRNAYITLALLHAGEAAGELETEILQLERRAETSDDAYELGVLACALAEAGRDSATKAGIRLLAMQSKDGSLLGKGSITGSGPRDLRVETTAFAVLAWLSTEKQGPAIDGAVQRAVRFLGGQRRNGRFGATQATILALKALTAYAGAHGRSLQPGTLQLFVNDKPVATRKLLASERRTISFDGLAGHLKLGENRVRIELSGGSELPWSLDLSYRADRPASSPDCAVALATRLDKPILNEGETVALHAVVHNRTDKPVPNPMVLLGLPAGLHVSEKILDDLIRVSAPFGTTVTAEGGVGVVQLR